jgi:hypothetical protein
MDYDIELLFRLSGMLAIAGWVPAWFIPERKITRVLVHQGLIPGLLALAYIIILSTFWGEAGGGFGSFAEVKQLFSHDALLLAGWLHYLAFDLLIGARIGRDAHHKGYSKIWIIPVQILVFMAGPAGWLTFTIADQLLTARKIAAA